MSVRIAWYVDCVFGFWRILPCDLSLDCDDERDLSSSLSGC